MLSLRRRTSAARGGARGDRWSDGRRFRLGPLRLSMLLAMLLATGGATVAIWRHDAGQHRETQVAWARKAGTALRGQVGQTAAALLAVRGIFAADGHVSAGAFARFTAVQLSHSRLLAITWTPLVLGADRGQFERSTGLRITERARDGSLRPAAARAVYFPLRYLAPASPAARRTLGLDGGVYFGARAGQAAARDTGASAMSGAVALGRGPQAPRGAVLFEAIYARGAPLGTVAERRAALRGFTGGAFRYDQLAAPILRLLPKGATLEILEGGRPLFARGGTVGAAPAQEVTLAGRRWSVRVGLAAGSEGWIEIGTILGTGLTLTLLVGLLFAQGERRERERAAAHAELRRKATTDAITGLGNRHKLEVDLARAVARSTPEDPIALLVFDLNGFKAYNDSFGHPAGDALLTRLGRRLAEALPTGAGYRQGGDEFCALVPLRRAGLSESIERACAALTEEGEGFAISSAHGAVLLPAEASDPEAAMVLADERMYRQKAGGRVSAGRQSADVLMKVLAERDPDLGEHLDTVAVLAEEVGRRLGLAEGDLDELRRAARLHDVGKVAIPDSILAKAGPLDADELAFLHRHTLIGARILRAAPALASVAGIVRASHERWDGQGYPDGLVGTAIPLAARIIFACDALEAMTSSDRAYRAPVSRELAVEELRRCAGSQFDPRVVGVLEQVTRQAGSAGTTGAPPTAPRSR